MSRLHSWKNPQSVQKDDSNSFITRPATSDVFFKHNAPPSVLSPVFEQLPSFQLNNSYLPSFQSPINRSRLESRLPSISSPAPIMKSVSPIIMAEEQIWQKVLATVQSAVNNGQAEQKLLHELRRMKMELQKPINTDKDNKVNNNSSTLSPSISFETNVKQIPKTGESPPYKLPTGNSSIADSMQKSIIGRPPLKDGRFYPMQSLKQKKSFCGQFIQQPDCFRCRDQKKKKNSDVRNNSGSGSSKVFPSSDSGSDSSGKNVLARLLPGLMPVVNDTLLLGNGCNYCYVKVQKYFENFNCRIPDFEEPGFWHSHSLRDKNGNIACPELQKYCQLCFANGSDAHVFSQCPLNLVA